MPLIGGGGSPNVVGGGAPAGVGTSINYIGEHAYGFSGTGNAGTSGDFTAFDFTSAANSYVWAKLYITYDADDLGSGEQFGYNIEVDGTRIFFTRREASATDIVDNPLPSKVEFLIPPSSRIVVTGFSNGSGIDMSFVLTGRVYA
jgi:hypothetical protein